MTGKFVTNKNIDINKDLMRGAVLQLTKDCEPKWPCYLNDQQLLLMDVNKIFWYTEIKVNDVSSSEFTEDMKKKSPQYEYLIVIPLNDQLHSIYVKRYDSSTKQVKCMNSHGEENSEPSYDLDHILKFYRVKCTGSVKTERSKKYTFQPLAQTYTRSSSSQPHGQGATDPGYVMLSGMVWSATEGDIKEFLHDCNVQKINIISTEEGKPSGSAVVKLGSKDDVAKAFRHDKQFIRERWVKVDEIDEKSAETIINPAPGNESCSNSVLRPMPSSSPQSSSFGQSRSGSGPGFVRLSGMVWTVSEEDILNFLHDCTVREIRLIPTEDGKPSGTAVVKLGGQDDVLNAVRHTRESIRERWVLVEEISEVVFKNLTM